MSNERNDNDTRLIKVIRIFAGLSLGTMAAFLVSIREVTPNLRIELSPWTVVAFALALVFSTVFWRLVFQSNESTGAGAIPIDDRRRRAVLFAGLSVLLCLATVTSFGLSLKGIANDRIREILQGAAIAVLTLTVLGLGIWRIARFLDHDSHRATRDQERPPGPRTTLPGKSGPWKP